MDEFVFNDDHATWTRPEPERDAKDGVKDGTEFVPKV
jgi:hypothetical protein